MIEKHANAVLFFSGGKDSLACLYLLRPHWHKITVLWVNTGAAYPETVAQMELIQRMVPHFVEVRSDQQSNLTKYGYPVDVLPMFSTEFSKTQKPQAGPTLQSWISCCGANLWRPMWDAVHEIGATLVIRGQRNDDMMKSIARTGDTLQGVTIWHPLEDWTSDDVLAYLSEQHVSLPDYYEWSDTSLDCWNCTAFIGERKRELENMHARHPEKWEQVRHRMMAIRNQIDQQAAPLAELLRAH